LILSNKVWNTATDDDVVENKIEIRENKIEIRENKCRLLPFYQRIRKRKEFDPFKANSHTLDCAASVHQMCAERPFSFEIRIVSLPL
jgi:hypothetical protein